MLKRRILFIVVILSIMVTYTLVGNMKPTTHIIENTQEFSKDGFIDASTLSNTDKLVASNATLELYLDETTSYFKVVDKRNGSVWESNPSIDDPWESTPGKSVTVTALDKQKSTLELSYFNSKGSMTSVNNYTLSISHPATIIDSAGLKTFSVKYVDNGFQILYMIEDNEIDYLYFPKYVTAEFLESREDRNILETIAYKTFNEDLQVYEMTDEQYKDISKLVKKKLYAVFYEELGYTRERAIEENESYGYFEQFEKVYFEIAINVVLTEKGIDASIIKNSIVEPDNVKLATITFLPLFGTAVSEIEGVPTEGYIVLPDGSGAVLEFNNGKYYQKPYQKRVYGEDFALLSYKMQEIQQKITLPLFGMVKEDSAYAAIITQGDAMSSIHADVSGRIDSYNKAYVSFKLRENESITLGSGYNQYGIDLWTEDIVDTDFTVSYTFLTGEESNYVGIANVYKNYLEDQFNFTRTDTSNETLLTLELVGAYQKEEFFVGVPYQSINSLTSFSQAEEITQALIDRGLTNIDVRYLGISDGGLKTEISDSYKIENALGSSKDYRNLVNFYSENHIGFYPNITLMTAQSYHKLFDRFMYTSNRLDGSNSMDFTYHLPSKLPYSETPYEGGSDEYVINPLYYQSIYQRLSKDYQLPDISYQNLGAIIAGSYNQNDLIYKQEAMALQVALLESMRENLMLSSPLGYALPYADVIVDLPTEATLYAILDYQIPLLQLVLSGKVDYSSSSMNMASDRSIDYQFLKALETGSNIKYTLSYEDSKALKDTEFNYYISTQYTNWINSIEVLVKEMDSIGIHDGYLVGHERIANNLYKVTYSQGLVLVINYNLSAVTYEGETINAMDYLIAEVD